MKQPEIRITPPNFHSFAAQLVHKTRNRPLAVRWSELANEALLCVEIDTEDVVEEVVFAIDKIRGAELARDILSAAIMAHRDADELFARLRYTK